jgi:Ca2+/H+ antiporter, TMEM165/GDT1 family
MSAGVVATVFVLVAVAELPDKTMIATLVMGSRGRPGLVWLGAAGAFLVHVSVAVGAGRLIELLPHRAVEIVVTVLFFAGGAVMLALPEHMERERGERDAERGEGAARAEGSARAEGAARGEGATGARRGWRVAGAAFGVILVGELGDLTQLLTVNLAAKYHQPASVFVGAYAALLGMSAAGAFGGRALLRWLPLEWIRRAGGIALLGLGAYGIYSLSR